MNLRLRAAEDFLGNLLRYGVVLCALVTACGLTFRSDQVIRVGIMLLIALPIVRVGVTAVIFGLMRDYLYSIVSAIVLGVLAFGLILGHGLG
jgi:uncharacterized membrane protein